MKIVTLALNNAGTLGYLPDNNPQGIFVPIVSQPTETILPPGFAKWGNFNNLTAYASFLIAGVPEDRQIQYDRSKLFCHGTRIGDLAFVEFVLSFGEDFGLVNEDNNNDRFAFKLSHPDYLISPIALRLGMTGQLQFEAYFQNGNLEGRYFGDANIKEWPDQGWLFNFWLPETSAGKNGMAGKVSREFPHDTNELWKGATIKVSGWYEAVPVG